MLEGIEKEKLFFSAGDVVRIKHDITDRPTMLVKEKVQKMIKDDAHFIGIKCFWFSKDGLYQEQIFSTKDLELLKPVYPKLSTPIKD